MISNTITSQIAEALKAHDEVRLSTLRMLSSALNYEKIAKQHELSEEEELMVVKKETKKRTEAIEIYQKHKNEKTERLKDREEQELKILQEFLPEQLSDDVLLGLVKQTIQELGAVEMKHMGKVIGAVKLEVGAKADGARIAELVKKALGARN